MIAGDGVHVGGLESEGLAMQQLWGHMQAAVSSDEEEEGEDEKMMDVEIRNGMETPGGLVSICVSRKRESVSLYVSVCLFSRWLAYPPQWPLIPLAWRPQLQCY